MPRRSKRLRTGAAPEVSGPVDDPLQENVTSQGVSASGAKRSVVRRKRGSKVESISQLPPEVLCEIFRPLHPLDLLNLSRTSKYFRSILMSRSSRSIWKTSRAHIEGLPECPGDMSEPEYANLAFSSYCNFCAKAYVGPKEIFWVLRTRICKPCIAIHLHEFHTRPAPEIPIDIIPFCENKDGHKFVDKKLLRQYEIEREGLAGAALVEWYDLKRSQCAAREEHAELCEEWNEDCNLRRTNKLNDLRSQRFEAIKAKLSELGWEAEIDHVENDNEYRKKKLSHHKLVKKPQSLTNRIWNNIKDDLIQFLTDHKAKRLEKLRGDVIRMRESVLDEVLVEFLDAYAVSQPLHAIFPPTVDLAILPLFRDIIEETPIEENVTKAHFQNAIRELPQTIELWRRAKDEMLLNLINDHPGTNEKATLATLQRATTLFRCRGRPISYPRILTHSCPGKILYDPVTSEKAMSILQECGLDPTMMSDALLMDSSLYFECLRCPTQRQERSRSIMKWPTVIEHVHDHHGPRAPYVIQRADLSSAERYLVEKLELIEKRRAFKENRYKSKLICRQCKSKLSWDRSFDHLKTHHPEILADDDTTWEYGNSSPERFMALGLDADASLCEPPVTFYPDLPFISIRRALQSEIPRRSDYQLDKQTQDLLASLPTDGSVNNLISPGFLSDPEFGL